MREKSKDYCTADLLQSKNWLHVQDFATGKNFSSNQYP